MHVDLSLVLLALSRLQDPRTIRKIVSIDENTTLAFAGLTGETQFLFV